VTMPTKCYEVSLQLSIAELQTVYQYLKRFPSRIARQTGDRLMRLVKSYNRRGRLQLEGTITRKEMGEIICALDYLGRFRTNNSRHFNKLLEELRELAWKEGCIVCGFSSANNREIHAGSVCPACYALLLQLPVKIRVEVLQTLLGEL
jgi:rubrerythrin